MSVIKVRFVRSGVAVEWDPAEENLLEFAEMNGVSVDYGCRAGSCTTCMTRVLSGRVQYPTPPDAVADEGHALMCCSVPETDLELDL